MGHEFDLKDEGGVGVAVRRKEDLKFLTGKGRFLDDIHFPDALACYIVRSPFAHARIVSINRTKTESAEGVIAIFTGDDMEADNVGPMRSQWCVTSTDGTPMKEPPRWAIARGTARHVGEPVAVVIAETFSQAADAAELLEIEFEELPAVTVSAEALKDGAAKLHDEAPGNKCYDWERGDQAAVEEAFAKAAHTVDVHILNNRLVGAAIETRGTVGQFDPATGEHVLYSTTQAPHHIRRNVAEQLGINENALRVISPDVGGGFGNKGKHYPEETIMAWAARKLGRTVKWMGQRHESFISDTQARDHDTTAELALDEDGNYLGLRVKTIANLGAYISTFGANIPSAIYSALLAGVYKTPAIHIEITGVFTNTVPTDAYRGAGRPEACYVLEKLSEAAAKKIGKDPVSIRDQNMIRVEQMPFTTPIGPTYDSGNFPNILSQVVANSNYAPGSKDAGNGKLKGMGLACFVETSGVAPSKLAGMMGARVGFFETARVKVDSDGSVTANLGTHNHGQAHETVFAQIISEKLGISSDDVTIVEGDTAMVPVGNGTYGSRSIAVGGSALNNAAVKVIEKGRKIAAHMMEAAEADVQFEDGAYTVAGTDKQVAFKQMAREANLALNFPHGELEPGLDETSFYDPENFAYSNGGHVCEVEVDPETGKVDVTGYWLVDDIGTVINPMVVEGQIHGGLAQGLGQALTEHTVYDSENGQMLSGSFMDYGMPRADDMPYINSILDQSQPCTHNPLGAKGCGESGTIGSPPALVSAVLDALYPLGVQDIQMPLTPHRVWEAIQAAKAS